MQAVYKVMRVTMCQAECKVLLIALFHSGCKVMWISRCQAGCKVTQVTICQAGCKGTGVTMGQGGCTLYTQVALVAKRDVKLPGDQSVHENTCVVIEGQNVLISVRCS